MSDEPRRRQRRTRLVVALGLASTLWLTQLHLSDAAFTGSTASLGNDVSALTVMPPTTVDAAMTLNVVPLLTCRVALSWTPSPTPGVTGYEVVRVTAATGIIDGAPSIVAGTSFVDDPVPLQIAASAFEWRVTTLVGTWRSTYAVAVPDNALICLL
jgi:hypothetical protein